jgi:zinc finger HIT domain-containing protein 1
MLLMYRKDLATLMAESNPSSHPYQSAVSPPTSKPPINLCSVCGYNGVYSCARCALRYCSLDCKTTHDETRCERRGR